MFLVTSHLSTLYPAMFLTNVILVAQHSYGYFKSWNAVCVCFLLTDFTFTAFLYFSYALFMFCLLRYILVTQQFYGYFKSHNFCVRSLLTYILLRCSFISRTHCYVIPLTYLLSNILTDILITQRLRSFFAYIYTFAMFFYFSYALLFPVCTYSLRNIRTDILFTQLLRLFCA